MTLSNVVSVRDTKLVLRWLEDYICKPNANLGRKGAVCPFVLPALEEGTLFAVFHYEIDGRKVAPLKSTLSGYIGKFLRCSPRGSPRSEREALLVVLPNIPAERATVLDVVHADIKQMFVENGLMLGPFHQTCPMAAVRNPSFPVATSPVPLFAIRHMALHDILFLHGNVAGFSEYFVRFRTNFERGEVSNKEGFADLFDEAMRRFPEVTTYTKSTRV